MRAIIIHGTKGSPTGNWFQWLSAELQQKNVECIVPAMPTPENQSYTSWLEAFTTQCGDLNQRTILVGHSIGAIFVLRLLENLNYAITATVVVSPPGQKIGLPEYDNLNSTFFQLPFNWVKIRANCGKLFYFMGDDDPYVPQTQMLDTARNLDVTPNIIKNGGHLNSESGYNSFPLLLNSLIHFI